MSKHYANSCNARLSANGIVDLFVLTASTVDGVGVAGGGTLVDNRIKTGERSAGVAGHAPEGVGGARQQGCGGNGSGGPHYCGGVVFIVFVVRLSCSSEYCGSGSKSEWVVDDEYSVVATGTCSISRGAHW
jgi:hypothetical protein